MIFSRTFCLVLIIGFTNQLNSVSESGGDVFACVEVLDTNLLTEDLEVQVISGNGTAQGSLNKVG